MQPRRFLCTTAVLCLFACSSKQTQQSKTFDELLNRAEELRRTGATDEQAYQRLVFELETLGSQNAGFCADGPTKEKATAVLAQYPTLACELRVSEPSEKFYVATGFASPLRIVAECPAVAPFKFDVDSQTMKLSGEGMRFVNGYLNAQLRISSASSDATRNTLLFSARYYAQDFIDRLAALCRIDSPPEIKLSPQAYQIQANPLSDDQLSLTARDAGQSKTPGATLAKLRFRKGSMQLSRETQRALNSLKGTKKSLRITGYTDSKKSGERLANLRARAVASYLEEYADINKVELRWQAQAHVEKGIGVIIEEID